jgi:hypothetical protein
MTDLINVLYICLVLASCYGRKSYRTWSLSSSRNTPSRIRQVALLISKHPPRVLVVMPRFHHGVVRAHARGLMGTAWVRARRRTPGLAPGYHTGARASSCHTPGLAPAYHAGVRSSSYPGVRPMVAHRHTLFGVVLGGALVTITCSASCE